MIEFKEKDGQLEIRHAGVVFQICSIEAFNELPIDQIAKESVRDIVEDWFND